MNLLSTRVLQNLLKVQMNPKYNFNYLNDQEVVRSILYSRVFKEMVIGFQDTRENAFIDHFNQYECGLFESLVNGFELLCRNKTFSLPKQLIKVILIILNKKLYNIGDMVVKAKAEPIVEKLDQTALVNIEELV